MSVSFNQWLVLNEAPHGGRRVSESLIARKVAVVPAGPQSAAVWKEPVKPVSLSESLIARKVAVVPAGPQSAAAETRGQGTVYRVHLAGFANRVGARKLCARIKARAFNCLVKKR